LTLIDINLAAEARQDLRNIQDFISNEKESPQTGGIYNTTALYITNVTKSINRCFT